MNYTDTINITDEIIRNLSKMGYNGLIYPILRYFLTDNFERIFGNNEIKKDNIDYEVDQISKKTLIKILNGNEVFKIRCVNGDANSSHILCERSQDDLIIFDLFISRSFIENTVVSLEKSDDAVLHVETFAYGMGDSSFSYRKFHVAKNNEVNHVYDYDATLTPIQTKIRYNNWFDYERRIPQYEIKKSFFKRLIDEMNGCGTLRKVATTYDIINLDLFAKEIYSCLIDDAKSVNENKEKMRIRKM